jgi:hypothetical protein
MGAPVNGKFVVYKGQPLVREKNLICYGSRENKCVLFMMILSNKTIDTQTPGKKVEVPDSILGQVISTEISEDGHNRILKQFNKNGLYESLDFGIDVMNRYNRK